MAPEVWFPNLGIQIEHLPRVALNIFGVDLYIYGLLIGLALAAGTLQGLREFKKRGIDTDLVYTFLIWILVFCMSGARIYYVIFSWDSYKDNLLKIFALREGGLAIYGGIIAAIICAVVFTRIKKLNMLDFFDVGIMTLSLGQAIGRWGNFFNREAFGGYTDSLFAMRYLTDQAAYITDDIAANIVETNGAQYIQVHPTFLYESFLCLSIFVFIHVHDRFFKKREGELFAIYLMAYGVGRFFIEGLRTDQLYLWGTNVAVSQIVSAVAALSGVILFVWRRKTKPQKAEL
jgi:phosphatidylglycerol:prolipoprotein diacylglycerol transferase